MWSNGHLSSSAHMPMDPHVAQETGISETGKPLVMAILHASSAIGRTTYLGMDRTGFNERSSLLTEIRSVCQGIASPA